MTGAHRRGLWTWAAVGVLILVAGLTAWRYRLPALADLSADGFSGARAMVTLKRLLPDDEPHPRGSAAQAEVIGRLLEILGELGLESEVQKAEACTHYGPCAEVQNVMVHFPGEMAETVLVSAHTDSVESSPGAGDDGQGVAILVELARYLRDRAHRNTVTLLFTDGEEHGLLGATAFIEGHPTAARVGAAINLEARGQSGVSTLFRTAGEDAWLIDLYARNAPHPFTSSVHQVVFETMPHDTDLSIWERAGIPGVDFAFIERPEAYHTALDTVDRLEPRSVQSQGENALAMLRGLVDADLANPPRGHAAWFDVMGVQVVHWPRPWTFWFCLLWFGVTAVGCLRKGRSQQLRPRDLGAGTLVVLLALAGSLLLGWGLASLPLALHQWPMALVVVLSVLCWSVVIAWLTRGVSPLGLHLAACVFMTMAALPVALFWPGVAHLLVLPPVFATAGRLLGLRWPSSETPAGALLGLFVAGVLWFPLLEGVRIALGPTAIVVVAVGMGAVLVWALPLWRRGVSA